MKYKIKQESKYQIIYIYNDITQVNYFELKEFIEQKLLDYTKITLFDISQLSHIDSLGLGFIAKLHKEITKNGGKLVVICSNKHILEILKMAGFYNHIFIYSSEQEALKECEK